MKKLLFAGICFSVGLIAMADGILSNTGGITVTTQNGSTLTNLWMKQVVQFSLVGGTALLGVNYFRPGISGVLQTTPSQTVPLGTKGYLSNLNVCTGVVWPTSTNVTFTIKTNAILTTPPVATPITVQLYPSAFGNTQCTNSGTLSFVFPETENTPIFNGYTIEANVVGPAVSLSSQTIYGFVEYWYRVNP